MCPILTQAPAGTRCPEKLVLGQGEQRAHAVIVMIKLRKIGSLVLNLPSENTETNAQGVFTEA